MHKSFHIIILCMILASVVAACGKRMPKEVIDSKKMEDLLIDIHKSEAFMESDYPYYAKDNRKDSIRNAILAKHGVTRAEFDTSLVWYGMNIEKYIEIYKKVIERLQEEDNKTLALMQGEKTRTNVPTRSGDTVDIWNNDRYAILDCNIGSNITTFSISSDDNFRDGDKFIFKFRITPLNGKMPLYPIKVTMAAKDINDSVMFVEKEIRKTGLDSVTLNTSGALRKVMGSIFVTPEPEWTIINADSISLTRIHL